MTKQRYVFSAVGDGKVTLLQQQLRGIRPTEALVSVRVSLVSTGTERHYVAGLRPGQPPLELGYCIIGEVLQVGAVVKHVEVGDTVLGMGWGLALHSNYAIMPLNLISRVPRGIPDHHAVLAALGATAVHAMDRADLRCEDKVLVVGLGPVGLLVSLVASDRACQVWAWDLDDKNAASELFWKTLDPREASKQDEAQLTKVILCADADMTDLLPSLIALMSPDGNGSSRSKIVNVGRLACNLSLTPVSGNLDIVNVSRCGAGYRSDDYHHGLVELRPVRGEATVDVNLCRSLEVIARHSEQLQSLTFNHHSVDEALSHYNGSGFFPRGFNIIKHEPLEAAFS